MSKKQKKKTFEKPVVLLLKTNLEITKKSIFF